MLSRIRYPAEVRETIRRLPPQTKQVVSAALDEIEKNPYSGIPLVDELKGLWKYAANRYRIIYQVRSKRRQVEVVSIDLRKTVYEKLREILRLPSRGGDR